MTTIAVNDQLDLDGVWSLAISDQAIDLGADPEAAIRAAGSDLRRAEVPGNLELDLARSGVIDDPFTGSNIVALRRFEDSYVYYLRWFDAPEHWSGTPVLIFEGLDYDARIVLNGVTVGRTANMLIEHRIPVEGVLRSGGPNLLVVELGAPDRPRRRACGSVRSGSRGRGWRIRRASRPEGTARVRLGHHAARALGRNLAIRILAVRAGREN